MKSIILVALISVIPLFGIQLGQDHWEGSDQPGDSHAIFKHFSGKEKFTAQLGKQNQKVKFYYSITKTNGELTFIIAAGSKKLLDKIITEREEGTMIIDKELNKKITFVLKGHNADGSYSVKYDSQ